MLGVNGDFLYTTVSVSTSAADVLASAAAADEWKRTQLPT